jgi:hypothetical protein
MELHPVANPVKEAPVMDRVGEQAEVVDFYPTEEMVEIQLPGGFHLATDQ